MREDMPEAVRRRRAEEEDPINTVSLGQACRESLQFAQQRLGESDFAVCYNSVDGTLRQQLENLLSSEQQ